MSKLANLAVNGGPKAVTIVQPGRGSMGLEEKAAVDALFDAAIASGSTIGYGGPEEEGFCKEFAEYMGGGYVDAVNSGTSALYIALRSEGLQVNASYTAAMPQLMDWFVNRFLKKRSGRFHKSA